MNNASSASRLAYIDWMRGLACVLMFQWHCYNSWLAPEWRKSSLYKWSQLGGTLPAPLFIFLAGVSVALVTQRLREKGASRNAIAKIIISRGAEVFALGLAFRVQEYLLGYPRAPWTDLLRVDVLNILGLSMMILGVLCWLAAGPDTVAGPPHPRSISPATRRAIFAALALAGGVALATPFIWTSSTIRSWPWPLASYLNGAHTFSEPQPWLFPIFPWSAFAFAGLATGFFLFSDFTRHRETRVFPALGLGGALLFLFGLLCDRSGVRWYPENIYDFWHTSPNFFLIRCGILLILLFLVYGWCRWGLACRGFSPVAQLGNTSLLVYWVHIEFVYGRFSILPKGRCGIAKATAGLLAIFLAMLVLSVWRTRWKKRTAKVLRPGPRPTAATAESG